MSQPPMPGLEKLPFRSSRDDWRGFAEGDTREEAMAILEGNGPVPAIWIHRDACTEAAALMLEEKVVSGEVMEKSPALKDVMAKVLADQVFFQLGSTLASWVMAKRDALKEGLSMRLGVKGMPREVVIAWFDGALYAYRLPAQSAAS